jgi:hypothetical protein
MKNNTLLSLFICISFFAGLLSCEYKKIQPLEMAVPDNVSFSNDIIPILNSCAICHNGATEPDLRENFAYKALTEGKYVTPGSPTESKLIKTIQGGHPSASAVSTQELTLMKAWITQGAENN